jgi:OFA family oxalate/formate antiporter-like MFS transporter
MSSVQRPWAALAATTLLVMPLGSIYAFSVFLKPLESLLDATRSELATVFGIAAITYTIGMNIGPRFFGWLGIGPFLAICAALAATGIAISAVATSFAALALGYGGLFGLGGGLAYVAAQQGINLMAFQRSGLVNGYIVALLPCGAMLTAPACALAIERFGVRETLWGLAGVLLGTGCIAAAISAWAGMRLSAGPAAAGASRPAIERHDLLARLFVVFLLAAAAGLMVLSQAAGIVAAYGGATALATLATTGVSGAIAFARLAGGSLVDRFAIPKVMAAAQASAAVGALLISLAPSPQAAIAALLAVGMGYGIISGATAAAIGSYWQRAVFGRVAGRVYIAWCLAAVTLPILAARLFDLTGTYTTAFLVAGACNLVAAAVALTLPQQAKPA